MQPEMLLSKYYQFFNNGDADKFLDLLSDDVVHDVNQGETETGVEAFSAFVATMKECYKETASEINIMTSQTGNRAAAEFMIDGVYLKSIEGMPRAHGQKYKLRVGTFFEITNGKISRVTNYYNLPEWLEQVGG